MDDNATEQQQTFIEQASDIVSAYVSNNSVPISELPGLLAGVHAALTKLSAPTATVTEAADKPTPAQIRKSVTPDALISFIDGKPYKTLKRHLSRNGLTIEQSPWRLRARSPSPSPEPPSGSPPCATIPGRKRPGEARSRNRARAVAPSVPLGQVPRLGRR
uniref:MucR family transcriptional regulator n=1 Tax=Methylobacterium sp. B34 TaxID=95563 RepID=UPI0006797665